MSERLRWGILGTGMIAGKFAGQLDESDRSTLAAVGSRRQDSAARFAAAHGGTAYGSYEALLADDHVDAVYVSLPNGMHCEWTIRALEAGKHVLCEKPLASNATEAEEMFAAKRSAIRGKAFDRKRIKIYASVLHATMYDHVRYDFPKHWGVFERLSCPQTMH